MNDIVPRFLSTRWGPIVCGAVIGILAPLLVKGGNPGNMGICVACFSRDTAGAVGLHRAAPLQYIRPELIGLVLGAFAASLLFREFRPRTGSAPFVRFLLGAFSSVGALVFLGCPWRAWLRLSGGDGNALPGLAGLAAGIALGVCFLRKGYSLGRNRPAPRPMGWLVPLLAAGMLVLLLARPAAVLFSKEGPGSQHAPWAFSLGAGALIGILAQRSRFCTVGALRDLFLMRDMHLMNGVLALVVAAFATNLALGQFRAGFAGQPLAHTDWVWNFAAMALSGLAFTLGGGCPGRQLVLAGEGDGDAAVFFLGVVAGTAFAHNFGMAASPKGLGPWSAGAVIVGLAFCVLAGLVFREKGEAA
jgi:hypothetical protein